MHNAWCYLGMKEMNKRMNKLNAEWKKVKWLQILDWHQNSNEFEMEIERKL